MKYREGHKFLLRNEIVEIVGFDSRIKSSGETVSRYQVKLNRVDNPHPDDNRYVIDAYTIEQWMENPDHVIVDREV